MKKKKVPILFIIEKKNVVVVLHAVLFVLKIQLK